MTKNTKKPSLTVSQIAEKIKELKKTEPQPPLKKRYKTNDTTVEMLGEILRENPNGMLVLRDELIGLLSTWEKSGHESDRTFFLEGWNGLGSFDTDRIGRGSIFIPNLCIGIFGGIQPDKLRMLLEVNSASVFWANGALSFNIEPIVFVELF